MKFTTLIATVFISALQSALCADVKNDSNQNLSLQKDVFSVFEANKDCIVKVYGQKERDFGEGAGKMSKLDIGSGFLVSKDGLVMTSAFIVYSSANIWVEWKGILMSAEIVGIDPLTSLAVIRIQGDFASKNAAYLSLDSNLEISPVGSLLISISYEMGLPPSPRLGLAAGHNIEFGGRILPTVYLRTNIPSYSGSTGGAVFDIDGRFVGMTIASLPEVGGSFLLPTKVAARIKDDIILCSEPIYSWFGLGSEDRFSVDATYVVVNLVVENGPANKAGFKVGDIILEVNSKEVKNNTQLRQITFFVRPAEIAKFKVKRDSEIITLEIQAQRLDSEIVKSAEADLLPKFDRQNPDSEKKKDVSPQTPEGETQK